jgi:hypothetical protein
MLKGLLVRECLLWTRPVRLTAFALLPACAALAAASHTTDGMAVACILTALGSAAAVCDSLGIDRGNTILLALGTRGTISQVLVKSVTAPLGALLFSAATMISFPQTFAPTMVLAVPGFSLAFSLMVAAVKVTFFAR